MNSTIYGHESYSYSSNLDEGKFWGGELNSWMSVFDGNSGAQGHYIKVEPAGRVTQRISVSFSVESITAGNINPGDEYKPLTN